jgi:hypothetical protein
MVLHFTKEVKSLNLAKRYRVCCSCYKPLGNCRSGDGRVHAAGHLAQAHPSFSAQQKEMLD